MQFESQTAQYISTYYFETKARDEENYKSVVRIFAASIYFPCATFTVVSYLTFIYSSRISDHGIQYIKGECKKVKESEKQKNDKEQSNDKNENTNNIKGNRNTNNEQHGGKNENTEDIRHRRIMIFAISIASIPLILTLFSFHVVASVRLIQYGNEVLYDDNDDYDSVGFPTTDMVTDDDHSYDVGRDDQCVPIVYVVCSFFPTVLLFAMLLLQYCVVTCFALENIDSALGLFLQASLGGFLVYLGFYFAPFMLLAFINDPIQATLIYVIGASCVFCVYLLTYGIIFPRMVWLLEGLSSDLLKRLLTIFLADFYCTFKYPSIIFALASGISIAYFITILILIVTLGNFHDFQAIQNLTLPIIIGLLSIFVFKPFYKYVKANVEVYESNDADKEADNVSTSPEHATPQSNATIKGEDTAKPAGIQLQNRNARYEVNDSAHQVVDIKLS